MIGAVDAGADFWCDTAVQSDAAPFWKLRHGPGIGRSTNQNASFFSVP